MVLTNSTAVTYRIDGYDLYRLLDRDRLAGRGSHGVVHILMVAIALDHQRNLPLDSNLISTTRTLRPLYFHPLYQVRSGPF